MNSILYPVMQDKKNQRLGSGLFQKISNEDKSAIYQTMIYTGKHTSNPRRQERTQIKKMYKYINKIKSI